MENNFNENLMENQKTVPISLKTLAFNQIDFDREMLKCKHKIQLKGQMENFYLNKKK